MKHATSSILGCGCIAVTCPHCLGGLWPEETGGTSKPNCIHCREIRAELSTIRRRSRLTSHERQRLALITCRIKFCLPSVPPPPKTLRAPRGFNCVLPASFSL
ncbi:MAG: hypothetical protein C5B50_00975 [Verrucomicrobia bacterium]|nr:MAG: hypothetical protein C5B50_00975 [Verrucomicrobiota bacterium]